MANMSLVKNPMPSQDPNVRNKNFDEVALGYTAEQAIDEANRCLNCKHKPCVGGCPVAIDIPAFINEIKNGDFEAAYQIINRDSSLPAVCGRVCPQETQCEQKCVRAIKVESVAIGRLELGDLPSGSYRELTAEDLQLSGRGSLRQRGRCLRSQPAQRGHAH